MQQRKLGVNRMNLYFFIEISSHYRQKSGDVTKVPSLLEVPECGFTIISWEIVKFNAIKLNFSITGNSWPKIELCPKKGRGVRAVAIYCIYCTSALFAVMAVRVYVCRNCIYDSMYRWIIVKTSNTNCVIYNWLPVSYSVRCLKTFPKQCTKRWSFIQYPRQPSFCRTRKRA